MDFGQLGIVIVGTIVVGGGTVALVLWIMRTTREERAARVQQVDAAFQAVAARRGDRFVPGGQYDHPMAGAIEFTGRVEGSRPGAAFLLIFEEHGSEDPDNLLIRVNRVHTPKRKLKRKTEGISPEARALLIELLDAGHEVRLEARTKDKTVNDLIVSLNERRNPLELETLDALITRTVALASALQRGT